MYGATSLRLAPKADTGRIIMQKAIFHQLMIGAFMLVAVGPASAQEVWSIEDSDVLAGLDGVHVRVEMEGVELGQIGLTKRVLRTAIELRIRSAGVRILTDAERLETPRGVVLCYYLLAVKPEINVYAFRGDMYIVEVVWLVDGSDRRTMARTWQATTHVGTNVASGLRDMVIDSARQLTDEFLNDYLAANPKSGR